MSENFSIDPGRTAVLIMDYQTDILGLLRPNRRSHPGRPKRTRGAFGGRPGVKRFNKSSACDVKVTLRELRDASLYEALLPASLSDV